MTPSDVRAVIIDDSDPVRARLCQLLRKIEGVTVVGEASGGESGVRLVQQLAPDVVTLDLRLKGMSGIDVLKQIRALPAPPMVIVLTDYPLASYRRRCTELGAEHFLDKAFEIPKLVDAIRAHAQAARS